MTTVAQLRKAALGLPEVDETARSGMLAFAVRGRTFLTLTDEGWVHLQMTDQDAKAALTQHDIAERLEHRGTPIGIRIPLAKVNGKDLNALVRQSWSSRAPKRLAATLADVDAGKVPAHSDLPREIGRPATRALLGAGLVTLADVATRSREDLLAIHGVGPKAITILAAALEERGLQFAP